MYAHELLSQIPPALLTQIGEQTKVDHSVQKLQGRVMLELLCLAMVRSDRHSTRLLEHLYNSFFFAVHSTKDNTHQTRHSSIASRLSTISSEYFKQILDWAFEHFFEQIHEDKFFKNIKRYDSTMVKISSALVEWGMRVGAKPKNCPRQVQLKVTLGMKGGFPKDVQIHQDQHFLSEQTALRHAIENSTHTEEEMVCFDLGLTERKTFQSFDNQGIRFVTRGGDNLRYHTVKSEQQLPPDQDGLRFIQDSTVHLYASGHKLLEHDFRLVEVEIIETKKRLYFISNIDELSAPQIAQIYHHRWDIEVLFRFLKQELNLKHLLNHSRNGIEVQVYVALLVAILLTVFKKVNRLKGYKLVKLEFEEQLLVHLALSSQGKSPKNLPQNPTPAMQLPNDP